MASITIGNFLIAGCIAYLIGGPAIAILKELNQNWEQFGSYLRNTDEY